MHRHDEGDFADHGSAGDGNEGPEQRPRRSGPTAKQVLIGVLVVVLIVFAIANFRRVEVNFLLFTTQARVFTVIVVAGLLGFVAGYFVGRPGRAERKRMRDRDDEG
jgi:uncharacterized integral membrane protein